MIDSIIKGFEVWTDAQGVKSKGRVKSIDNISLEGIARLRELILDLAILGKLVSQDPNELSAIENLKLKKSIKDVNESILPKNQLFNLPSGWALAYIPNVVKDDKYAIKRGPFGSSLRKDFFVLEGYKVYEQQHAINDDFSLGDYYIDENKFKELKAFEVKPNDIIISCSGTVGKVAIAPDWMEPGIINQALLKLSIDESILLNNYFKILFPAFYMKTETLTDLQGTAQKNMVSVETLKNEPFPLPPLDEQKRIVIRVNELMSLCDKLEEEQTNNLTTHHYLVKCLLETLTQANDADELESSWEKVSQHFDTLFCTDDSVEQLKQTILQLAAMGKLTKQEPNDELGSDVLNLVFKEKEKLAEKGIIKKPNKSFSISDDEKPFNIAEKWAWARLSDTGIGSTGKTPSTSVSKYFRGDIPFIGPGQITENGAICDSDKTLTEEGSEYSTIANTGDIIMVCIGGSIGKCAIVNSKIAFNQQLNCISPLIFDSKFLYNTFNAPFFKEQILKKATGSATPIINRGKWEEIVIPVPSKSEQVRIVSRINELFSICESLKERISKSGEIKNTLSNSIIEVV